MTTIHWIGRGAAALISLSVGASTAFAHGGGVSQAKIAELGLHRIERLVTLRKIDPSFRDGLTTLKLAKLVQSKETDPLYRVIGQTTAPASGLRAEVEILMDAEGRVLQAFATEGDAPLPAPVLPGTDPVTLAEAALHAILDGSETREELEPFESDLAEVTIAPLTDTESGAIRGVEVVVSKRRGPETLKIRVRLSGEVESIGVITPETPTPSE